MKRGAGRSELHRHLQGKKLKEIEAIKAKCYDCTGGYADGLKDCGVKECPLHPFMPYRGVE